MGGGGGGPLGRKREKDRERVFFFSWGAGWFSWGVFGILIGVYGVLFFFFFAKPVLFSLKEEKDSVHAWALGRLRGVQGFVCVCVCPWLGAWWGGRGGGGGGGGGGAGCRGGGERGEGGGGGGVVVVWVGFLFFERVRVGGGGEEKIKD